MIFTHVSDVTAVRAIARDDAEFQAVARKVASAFGFDVDNFVILDGDAEDLGELSSLEVIALDVDQAQIRLLTVGGTADFSGRLTAADDLPVGKDSIRDLLVQARRGEDWLRIEPLLREERIGIDLDRDLLDRQAAALDDAAGKAVSKEAADLLARTARTLRQAKRA